MLRAAADGTSVEDLLIERPLVFDGEGQTRVHTQIQDVDGIRQVRCHATVNGTDWESVVSASFGTSVPRPGAVDLPALQACLKRR